MWAPLTLDSGTEDWDPALSLEVTHHHEPVLGFLRGLAAGTEPCTCRASGAKQPCAWQPPGRHPRGGGWGGATHWFAWQSVGHTVLLPACPCLPPAPTGGPREPLTPPSGPKHIPDPRTLLEKLEEPEEDRELQLQAGNYREPCPLHMATVLEEADMVWMFQEARADLSKSEPVCSPHLAVEAHAADSLEILPRAGSRRPRVRGCMPWGSTTSGPTPFFPASSAHTEPLNPGTKGRGRQAWLQQHRRQRQ